MIDKKFLPDFLIVGILRCGTSSLFEYLKKHPQLIGSKRKETHYFDGFYDNGLNWYKEMFPPRTDNSLLFEATPHYFIHYWVPKRIKQLLPNVKIILLFRDPTARAWSHFCHRRKDYSLKEKHLLDTARDLFRCGLYKEHLERWLNYFNEDQFLILQSEYFFLEPHKTVRQCCKFLNINEPNHIDYKIYDPLRNKIRHPTEYPKIPKDLKIKLDALYSKYNAGLNDLLKKATFYPMEALDK